MYSVAKERLVWIALIMAVSVVMCYFGFTSEWRKTEIIGKFSGFVALVAFFPYYSSILRGETRPNRVTWLIWTLTGFLLEGSYFVGGARDTNWVAIVYVIAPLIVLLLSIKYGTGGTSYFDLVSLCLSLVGIFFWIMLTSFAGLILFLLSDLFAALPTIKKCFRESEDVFAWILTASASILNIFAVETWEIQIYIYPIYASALYLSILALVIRRNYLPCGLTV
jgi:hypothetical protein